MGLVLIDRFLSWSTPSTRGCKSSRSELWPFWPLNINRIIINVQVTSLRPRETFQKLSKHVSNLLKWTTILITAGFPVTMSCIWSTFELHSKQTCDFHNTYLLPDWPRAIVQIHRPLEDQREQKEISTQPQMYLKTRTHKYGYMKTFFLHFGYLLIRTLYCTGKVTISTSNDL